MDQTQTPITTIQQHPEEEAHHENGASKMFRKVKAKAKKIKNSITKQGQSQEHDDHDVVEEDDEDDELEPELISVPVRGGVTDQPESPSHPREVNVPEPEKIVPSGTKVFPVVSSDYTKPIEPVSLQDSSYGHEVLSDPVRTTDTSDKEQRREELTDRDESREAHHEPMDTHVPLLSETEDVTSTFAPGGEDEDLGGQRKVNVETPKNLEEDSVTSGGGSDYLSGVSNDQSKVNDLSHEGGEAEVPEIAESLGILKVSDESSDQKLGFERDLLTRSHEIDRETESAIGKDSPVSFGAELEKDFSTRSHEFDMKTESGFDEHSPSRSHEFDLKTESGVDKNSPMEFGGESKTGLEEDSSRRSYESDLKTESENVKNSTTGFDGELGAKLGEDSPTRSYESDLKTETEINKNSPTGFGSASIVGLGEDFPAESHELGLKNESESGKDSPTGFIGESGTSLGEDFPVKKSHGYGEESEAGIERNFPASSDDVKVETELGRDLPTETHDQFSPDISRPKERDDFVESRDSFEETRDETEKPKQSSYTEQFASGGDETQVAGTFDEKLTPEKEAKSTVTPELPISGGGSDLEEKQQGEEVEKGVPAKDYLAEKLTPGEEDKALSDMISEKLHLGGGESKTTTKEVEKIPSEKEPEEKEHGEEVAEEAKGVGMVGMIKGWFGGGATEEVKPKSPHSVEESSQSLGSTVGTTGFSDSGKSELRETGDGSGVVSVRRELGN
ncbi:Low-temperature-induced 78 kDa protein [Cardamine amara subsp. amara]|uniref:Low-temperature-induced 78 kDa protein n=1 Tax=Cardamine amara subsp. amara TaxID=228776 RepID=A0ABD0ZUR2_CARAN